ncbi:MAG: hypothetical protein ACKO3M_05900, partial [Rubrivivax sp.]
MNSRMLLAALVVAAPLLAQAQGSLAERRQAIIQGTAPGKVLIEAPRRPDPAASAPDAKPLPAAAAASSAATAAMGAPARLGVLGRLPPPSGRPLSESRRLDAPDQ